MLIPTVCGCLQVVQDFLLSLLVQFILLRANSPKDLKDCFVFFSLTSQTLFLQPYSLVTEAWFSEMMVMM